MRKKFTFLILFFTTFVFGQNTPSDISIDDRLFEVFDKDYLEALKSGNPVIVQRWNFYLDNAWYITGFPEGKEESNYPLISIANLAKVNIFLLEKQYGLKR